MTLRTLLTLAGLATLAACSSSLTAPSADAHTCDDPIARVIAWAGAPSLRESGVSGSLYWVRLTIPAPLDPAVVQGITTMVNSNRYLFEYGSPLAQCRMTWLDN